MKNFKIAIIGSRSFNDYERLSSIMNRLNSELNITHIVSGGAKGADLRSYLNI